MRFRRPREKHGPNRSPVILLHRDVVDLGYRGYRRTYRFTGEPADLIKIIYMEEANRLSLMDVSVLQGLSDNYDADKIYLAYYMEVPCSLTFGDVDDLAFLTKFRSQFGNLILKEFYDKFFEASGEERLNDHIILLSQKILIYIEKQSVCILAPDPGLELVRQIIELVRKLQKKKQKKSEICVIVSDSYGLSTKEIKFRKPRIDLSTNYQDDFPAFHSGVVKELKKKWESGVYLFHGKPGTGKSTYIRYLVKQIRKKTIFLSPKLAGNLDDVQMIKLLLNNKNSLLVIEDAEGLIVSRNQERNSHLSTILNLTDGILGESLGIQIIATFNTDVQNIDPALKRKGRLKSAYEFKALSPEKANKLLREQNINYSADEEMTLAEIYNISEEEQYKSPARKAVGFR